MANGNGSKWLTIGKRVINMDRVTVITDRPIGKYHPDPAIILEFDYVYDESPAAEYFEGNEYTIAKSRLSTQFGITFDRKSDR